MLTKEDDSNKLVWLFDKSNTQKTSIQHMQVWKYLSKIAWLWLPIFILLCFGIYSLTILSLPIYGKKIIYSKSEKMHLIGGVLVSCCILSVYAIFDTIIPSIFIDKKNNDLLFRPAPFLSNNRGVDDIKKMVIMSDNKFMITPYEKKNMSYSISLDYFKKLQRNNKIDAITAAEWFKTRDAESHVWKGSETMKNSSDHFLEISFSQMSTSSTRRVALLLTIAFIVSQWDIKVYDKLSYWIYGGIIIEAIITSLYLPYNDTSTPYIWMYIKKRVQVMTALLGIIVLFLFNAAARS
jgi:hypothetical protein